MSSHRLKFERHTCYFCACNNYPMCTLDGRACPYCICEEKEYHYFMDKNGYRVSNVPDCYKECQKCMKYLNPNMLHYNQTTTTQNNVNNDNDVDSECEVSEDDDDSLTESVESVNC